MKNLALSILALLFSFCLVGQTGTVRGKLVDTTALELSNATISVLLKKDTSLVSYTLSDSKGYFEIKNLSYTDYVIFISFTGYELYTSSFSISANNRISDFGLIMLWPEYKLLSRVIVAESPVRMNGDTISFKANAL